MKKIAFFDSGIGGITVLAFALKELPNENYIYYADTKNVPYGTKTPEEVKGFVFDAMEFLIKKEIKAVVVACNTATSIAINDIRKRYKNIPIIGMEPAVKPALIKSSDAKKKVIVTATELTLKEKKFKKLVSKFDKYHLVEPLPLPKLVEFAEKGEFNKDKIKKYLSKEFGKFNFSDYGTVVLGCTHFPFFYPEFREVLPDNVNIIDGNYGTVMQLKRLLIKNGLLKGEGNGSVEFFSSLENGSNDKFYSLLNYFRASLN